MFRKIKILSAASRTFGALMLFSPGFLSCQQAASEVRMVGIDEPGIPFILDITVVDLQSGKPVAGAEVFVYQTNAKGKYDRGPDDRAHIQGTAYSDVSGKVRFITIYPRGYNDSDTGEHMHFEVTAPGYQDSTPDLMFSDYYGSKYDYDNPTLRKVYLTSLEKNNDRMKGKAKLYLRKSRT